MIINGKIQDKNGAIPSQEAESVSSKNDAFVQDPEFRTPRSSLGVANVQDGFEKVQQDDLLQKIGPSGKSIVDPLGYPGEEWLWQE